MGNKPLNLSANEGKCVMSDGHLVVRDADGTSAERFRFLRFLAERELPVEMPISITEGKEIYAFAEAEKIDPGVWDDAALTEVGKLVRALHDAGREYVPAEPAAFRPWYLRELDGEERIWCHGDLAPWNLLTRGGVPHTLVDWEYAGPLDPFTEFARVCWLFVQLCDDDIAEMHGLPPVEKRAEQVRLLCDVYGLPAEKRRELIERIMTVIICETAHEAIDPKLTPESTGSLWGFAWRTRSLYWIQRHRALLERALR